MRTYARWALTAVAVAVLTGAFNAPARADEKDPLREEILKLNSVTGEDAQRAKLVALAKDKEKAKKLVTEAGKMMKEAKGKDKPLNFNGAYIVARLAHFLKLYDIAEPLYDYLLEDATKLKSGAKMVQAYEGLIAMHWDNKKYNIVSELCEKFLADKGPEEYEKAKPAVIERWVQSLAKEEKFDEALRMANLLIEADKETAWYFMQLKGSVLREQGKLQAAIDIYNESFDSLEASKIVKGEEKDQLKDATRYILSGLYVEAKDIDKAAKQLQTLIKRNPEAAVYKNDLGFIWCDNDLNLDEAEKLIREALELDKKRKEKLKADGKIDEVKENPAYLDSMGWVLFKKKKYEEALEFMKRAAGDEDEGGQLEILDHLADVYMALGKKKEAVAAWEKALKDDTAATKRDNERRRKVTEKLKKARAELKD
jgi:predicted Zn-dependent protease